MSPVLAAEVYERVWLNTFIYFSNYLLVECSESVTIDRTLHKEEQFLNWSSPQSAKHHACEHTEGLIQAAWCCGGKKRVDDDA
jgi:hypothetical protein